ncbi:MAG: hypothetical protein Q9193_004907, partial [Seirophora villosa]
RIDAAHVRETRLDLRERGRVREAGEGVPAVDERPHAGEGVPECLGEVVVETAHVDGEDGLGAEGFHVCDGKVVDVAAVEEHTAFVAQRRYQTCQRHGSADIAPHVAGVVVFAAGFADIGRVAVKVEPEVFDLRVAECFEDSAVELVAGGVGCGRIRQVESEAPHAAHSPCKFLCAAVHGHNVCIAGVKGSNECTDGCSSDDVDGYTSFFESTDHSDLRYPSCATSAEDKTDRFTTESSR